MAAPGLGQALEAPPLLLLPPLPMDLLQVRRRGPEEGPGKASLRSSSAPPASPRHPRRFPGSKPH